MTTTTNLDHRGLCRDADPELFFPTAAPGTASYRAQVAQAKQVCGVCPVRQECLEFALDVLTDGVAGGLDVEERRVLRLQRDRVAVAVPDVDVVMVGRLVDQGAGSEATAGASEAELAAAAVALVQQRGASLTAAAERLHVRPTSVRAWLDSAGDLAEVAAA